MYDQCPTIKEMFKHTQAVGDAMARRGLTPGKSEVQVVSTRKRSQPVEPAPAPKEATESSSSAPAPEKASLAPRRGKKRGSCLLPTRQLPVDRVGCAARAAGDP